jgi:PPM family protein phosphatase
MKYRFCAKTDSGRIRYNNEDSVAFDEDAFTAVLADGMGGHNAGEIASGMATAFIKSELSRWLLESGKDASGKEVRQAMKICANNANLSIFNSASFNVSYAGMGTTLVMAVFRESTLWVGHIGDSRCYRLRQGVLEQLTKDHSVLQEQIDAGLVSPEQAANSSIKNLVTRALGVEETVMLEVNEHQVELDDLYLMCSDGLSDMVNNAAIAKIVTTGADLEYVANQLVDAANANGGLDNISVLLVEIKNGTKKRSLIARLLGK